VAARRLGVTLRWLRVQAEDGAIPCLRAEGAISFRWLPSKRSCSSVPRRSNSVAGAGEKSPVEATRELAASMVCLETRALGAARRSAMSAVVDAGVAVSIDRTRHGRKVSSLRTASAPRS